MKSRRLIPLLVVLALLIASCGGGSESASTTTTEATNETTVAPKDPAGAGGAVDNLEDVRGAIVRIVAEGSFVDPEVGQQYNAAGSGSGFFIDPSGIAITNNHVVTGAAFLQVYVDGEDEPRNARVLGVSECSDLAVIDVDGDGFPYLDWYDGDVAVGTEIYAAGFPLGDAEYTLLDGIISKEDAGGESDWASVDSVVEHSADTLPGNSGGPIVTNDGAVVAVNYAGNSAGQSYGIGRDEALKVLPRLMDGEDVTSIGINGQALYDETFPGIWVASVASGSPADLGGIEAGDLVTLIEGLVPATDGTMSDYCDVLRSHAQGDPISVEVYRPAEDVFLEGTLNTDKTLEVSFSFESSLGSEVEEVTGDTGSTAGYDSYVTLVDVNNTMSVDVPAAWSDTDVEDLWSYKDEIVGAAVSAATDYEQWHSGWTTSGMFFGASATLSGGIDTILDDHDFSGECGYDGRYDYEDALYTGAYDVWTNCGGEDTLFVVLVAEPPGTGVLMLIQVVVVSEADLEALDTVLGTFMVDEVALANLAGVDAAPTATGPTVGDAIDAAYLLPGDCWDDSSLAFSDTGDVTTVTLVSCDGPHDNEVVSVYEFPDAPYPGEEAVFAELDAVCAAAWPDYIGVSYEQSELWYYYLYPSEDAWSTGDRLSVCMAYDASGAPLQGSVFMSGR
jgi:serine protease Do